MEEYAHILDYLAQGLPSGGFSKREPLCYAVGEEEFKLFEIVPKANVVINLGDRVYIGKDAAMRTQVDHIKRRVGFEELTSAAKAELEFVVLDIVMAAQNRFIRFYNDAEAISLRKHMLEELPGLGKKTLIAILDERKKGKFKDFADLGSRVPLLKGPEKLIVKRIVLELSDMTLKHSLFVR
jgi:putative nucleotide binding protein